MTDEQKPESAEFRTREAQVADLSSLFFNFCDPRGVARSQILEAEARGAAEQRRKDAEGAEPVAWIIAQGFYVPFVTLDAGLLRGRPHSVITPLYTRPANVAALEDRVKELEREVKEEQRISNLRADVIDSLTNLSAAMEQEKHEAVAAERERCAKIIENHCEAIGGPNGRELGPRSEGDRAALCYAVAIREGGGNV